MESGNILFIQHFIKDILSYIFSRPFFLTCMPQKHFSPSKEDFTLFRRTMLNVEEGGGDSCLN